MKPSSYSPSSSSSSSSSSCSSLHLPVDTQSSTSYSHNNSNINSTSSPQHQPPQPRTMFTIDELLKETTSRSSEVARTAASLYNSPNEQEQREVVNNILNGSAAATSNMFRFFQVRNPFLSIVAFTFLILIAIWEIVISQVNVSIVCPRTGVSPVFWVSIPRSLKSSPLQTFSPQNLSRGCQQHGTRTSTATRSN